uniref:Ankyrin repeat domain-containing protein n=1 Tax=Daphnia galeata TaxID=27404 RepID=A0A8J2RWM2_9CRUS|nr:unnamed protein product [Daphnia galeata]
MVQSDVKERITSKEALEQIESDIKELKQKEPKLFELLKASEVNLEEVRTLIHDGVDVNCVNSDGCTPLLYLAKKKYLRIPFRTRWSN